MRTNLARRQFLQAAGFGLGSLGLGNVLFGQEPNKPKLFEAGDFGDLSGKLNERLADANVGIFDDHFLPLDGSWNGEATQAFASEDGTLWTHPMRLDGASAVVPTLDYAKSAARVALQSGKYDTVHICIPRYEHDKGAQSITWDKDAEGYVKPNLVYTNANQISMFRGLSREESLAASSFGKQIDIAEALGIKNAGNDGSKLQEGWLTESLASFDPVEQRQSQYQFVGFGDRFRARQQGGTCGGCEQVQQYPGYANCNQQYAGGYSYGCASNSYGRQQGGGLRALFGQRHATGGRGTFNNGCTNCDLTVRSTIGGLLRGEFLRPAGMWRKGYNLTIGQRLVARAFPRVAYRNGWIDCETAHLLLVKRLFVMIVAGGIAGAAAGGGAAAGIIFIP